MTANRVRKDVMSQNKTHINQLSDAFASLPALDDLPDHPRRAAATPDLYDTRNAYRDKIEEERAEYEIARRVEEREEE